MTNPQNSYQPWDVVKSFELGQKFSATAKGDNNGEVHFTVQEIDNRGRAIKLDVSGNVADGISTALQETWATSAHFSGISEVELHYGKRADSPYYNEHDTIGFDQ